jgi:predicted nucleotidyltransferase
MDFEAVTKYILDQFNKQRVRCAIIGGFALHAAGFPRATKDIDFLVHVEDLSKVKSILTGFGYDILHESKDVINFWGKLKELGGIDFIIAHRKYALAMLPKSKPYEIVKGCMVNVVVPEDIIGLKLQAMANDPSRVAQDMVDVQWLIRNHHQVLNKELLKEYFGLFGQETILEDIYKEINHAK